MYPFCEQNFNMVQVPKSGTRENLTLKAGHPPAVKAGGMRVAKKSTDENGAPEKEPTKRPDKPRPVSTTSRMHQVSVLMAGTLDKLGHDFPETPVSVRHSRVRPAVEKPHIPRTFFIQQPRKC